MLVSTLALFGLASSVFAAPTPVADFEVEERDLFPPIVLPITNTKVVDNAFATIKKATLDLDKAIKGITSTDLTILLGLDGKAKDLNNIVIAQTALVAKSPAIGIISALPVAAEAQDLINTIKSTLSDLKKIRKYTDPTFTSVLVVDDLKLLKASADNFVNTLKVKVPSIAQFLADLDRLQLDTAFDDAIKYFSANLDS